MDGEGMSGWTDDERRHDELMRRNMEFIIQQQAQFAVDIQRINAIHERAERKWQRTEESIRALLAITELHAQEIVTLDESDTRLEDSHARLLEAQQRTEEALTRLSQRTEESLSRLSQAQERTDRQLAETDRQMAETDKRLAETDERLNALINVVERYIIDGRNGR